MNIKQKKFFYGSQRQIKNLREGKPMMGCIAHNGEITSIEGGDEQASEAAASHIEAKPPPPYAQKNVQMCTENCALQYAQKSKYQQYQTVDFWHTCCIYNWGAGTRDQRIR